MVKEEREQFIVGSDKKKWPNPRQIINEKDSHDSQKSKLLRWLDQSLQQFLKEHGSFKFDANNNLNEEDFLRIYDLIESVGRCELKVLRESNEASRKKLYKEAFGGSESKAAFKKYVDKVYQDIEKEITLY